jgi:hypothetical protein
MKKSAVSFTAFFFLLTLLVSCKKDDNPVTPGGGGGGGTVSTTYSGTFASASESGSLSLTVAAGISLSKATAPVVAVTGTLKPVGGAPVTLTGTFDTGSNLLTVSGGSYTLIGTLSGGNLSGSYTGPHGTGQFDMKPSKNNSVKVFVGNYTGTSSGYFNLVQDTTSLSGLAVSTTGSTTGFSGYVASDSLKIYLPGSGNTLFLALGRFTNAADTAAAGIYDDQAGDSGTWQCHIAH